MVIGGTDQSVPWLALIPFAGSLLLFLASMITLWRTIVSTDKRAKDDREAAQQRANGDRDAAQLRANADREAARERADSDRRAAQERADADRQATQTREFNTWRRDAIVKAATDAVNAAIEAHDYYPSLPKKLLAPSQEGDPMDPISSAAKVIVFSSQTLKLVGAERAAADCLHMRDAITSQELRDLVRVLATQRGDAFAEAKLRFDTLREEINTRGNDFGEVVQEALQSVLPPPSGVSATPVG